MRTDIKAISFFCSCVTAALLLSAPGMFAQEPSGEHIASGDDAYLQEYLDSHDVSTQKVSKKKKVRSVPTREHVGLFRYIRDSIYRKHFAAGKLAQIKEDTLSASIRLPNETLAEKDLNSIVSIGKRDSLIIRDEGGKEVLIMNAIRDDETGEMVANETLNAAVVTATFRNVAERHGKVDLEWIITVPRNMFDSKWQIRFYPKLMVMGDTTTLESVYITGLNYRNAQLRGYEQYNRFLSKIVQDSTLFIDLESLEQFLQRNIPEIFSFKYDTSYVDENQFYSHFGVNKEQAIKHYTNNFSIAMNERRKARREKMYRKYVKAPIEKDGIRVDTVLARLDQDFNVPYIETIQTRKGLKNADVVISGSIYEQDRRIYRIPATPPLRFYISSLASFVDPTPRYLLKVIERRAEANSAYDIDFAVGKSDINMALGRNASEVARVKDNLAQLLQNENFDLDSITVASFASPEGSVAANDKLCLARARSVAGYFEKFVRHFNDSLKREKGIVINMDETFQEDAPVDIKFLSRVGGEYWTRLSEDVEMDSVLTDRQKDDYFAALQIADLDKREAKIKLSGGYKRIKEALYPDCRKVSMNFYLHRKGMVKDTVHTTELDTVYMMGVQALRDRDFELAVNLLRPYSDYNTAVAYTAMDYNRSAMSILETLPSTAQVEYMKALVHSRDGDDQNAVQCYLNACRMEPSYVFRGNLDPEIAVLIKRYGLNKEDEDEDFGY